MLDDGSKRGAVLQAMLDLISERGFHDTPMSLVAKKAMVATGTIYHHFKNKEEIIDRLYREIKLKFYDATQLDLTMDVTARAGYRRCWFNTYNFAAQNVAAISFLEQYANSPYIRKETLDELAGMNAPILTMVERAQEEGALRKYPLALIYALTYGPISLLIRQHYIHGLEITPELLDEAEEACWRSMAT